ncbi:MAG: nitroreductase family protein [Thermoplasmatota archaeon]
MVRDVIEQRRAYRSLAPVEITRELIEDLAECARLAPSCFNHQPWRYVFVHDEMMLEKMHGTLSNGNEWATRASMIIAVYCKEDDDCVIHDRRYYRFDTGLATAFLILRATELGLVAHPIAGYSPSKVSDILGIPADYQVITLVIVGRHADDINSLLTDKQRAAERERPERKPFDAVASINRYEPPA